jgi:hypothetical protein
MEKVYRASVLAEAVYKTMRAEGYSILHSFCNAFTIAYRATR